MTDLHTKAAADPDWLPVNVRQVLVLFERFDMPHTVTKKAGSVTVEVAVDEWVLRLRRHGKNFRKAKVDLTQGGEQVEVRSLMHAIQKLLGSQSRSEAQPSVRSTSDAARTNAVQARRASVIRV